MTNKTSSTDRPYRPGTEIEAFGTRAVVAVDGGGPTIEVMVDGRKQSWDLAAIGDACQVVSLPHGELVYEFFDAWVKDFPEGEYYRPWLTRGTQQLMLIRLVDPPHKGSPHGGVTGNYLVVSVGHPFDGKIRVAAHDCDDGLMVKDFPEDRMDQVQDLLRKMAAMAPFSMWDAAEAFEFEW